MPGHSEIRLASKLEFLRRADSYPHEPDDVKLIETHFAYVFLAGRFVYKLKKPIRFHRIDLTTPALRRANCELELILNRRLAEKVYIGVVPLRAVGSALVIDAPAGRPVDWLVKMHRLPEERMLDARAAAGNVTGEEIRRLLAKLAAFYARAARADWSGSEYRHRLAQETRACAAQLETHQRLLGEFPVASLVADQLAFLRDCAPLVEARSDGGRIVDAHGDLRPEHILLGDEPQIIDCLEFSTELRLLDTAEEIAFLALECERLGAVELAREILRRYRELCNDPVPQPLFAFYSSRRALVRAQLCAWHLNEPLSAEARQDWRARARAYLETARASAARAAP